MAKGMWLAEFETFKDTYRAVRATEKEARAAVARMVKEEVDKGWMREETVDWVRSDTNTVLLKVGSDYNEVWEEKP